MEIMLILNLCISILEFKFTKRFVSFDKNE